MKMLKHAWMVGAAALALVAGRGVLAGSIVRVSTHAGVHACEIQSGAADYERNSGEEYAQATAFSEGNGTVQVISTMSISGRDDHSMTLSFDCQRNVSTGARPSAAFNVAGYTNAFWVTVSSEKDFTLTATWAATCSGYVWGMPYAGLYDGNTWIADLFDAWEDKPHPAGAVTNLITGRSGERTFSIPLSASSYASVPVSSQQNDRVQGTITLHFAFAPKTDQAIAFVAIADQVVTNRLTLSASASSGLPVSFAVQAGPGAISGGSNLAFTATGLVSIVASQAGDAEWNAAAPVTNTFNVTAAAVPTIGAISDADFDGDRKMDLVLYEPSTGTWYAKLSAGGYGLVTVLQGGPGSVPVAADYDGDGKTDPAVYEQAIGKWQIELSGSGYALATMENFGGTDYDPVAGDYDGDGKADPAIYHSVNGTWQVAMSSLGYRLASVAGFGGTGYAAVEQHYDSDHRFDAAIYNQANGNWTILLSASSYITVTLWYFGGVDDEPVAGDFDGDGKADPAIYRESTATWQIKLSGSGYGTAGLAGFGGADALVAAGDYDGDRKADPIYLDVSTGVWHVKLSASGYGTVSLASGWMP